MDFVAADFISEVAAQSDLDSVNTAFQRGWGLIPSWPKDASLGDKMTNADAFGRRLGRRAGSQAEDFLKVKA